ncbi:carboxypeptidase-like regulatory domain-containing protein [uncultured Dokdonia sp.]|uniref:carboxypeptidase-like regulatory domain-containing protein n=1 Tax=uncultured Dokdonia sp. TaxID=575653 RepID=UPI00262B3A1B|nr:carboxypeptidase-like regulatory domain-containing protein [uncultured Dokdonia sp.]
MYAQTVSGTVYDSVTKEPLLGASVYFEGTTIGGITNEQGKFSLYSEINSTSQLVVTYLGYTDAVFTLSGNKPLTIYLTPKEESLDEVVVTATSLFTREELLAAFRTQFLGTTKAGQSCEILNEDALRLYYNASKKQLTVKANEVLRIKNPYLGYEIRFRLYDCKISYFSTSIKSYDVQQSYYAGTSFFVDEKKDVRKYKKRREEVYEGSSLHFMRTVATEQWDEEDFVIYKKGLPVYPKTHFVVSDTLGIKKVQLTNPVTVLYDKKKRSEVRPKYTHYTIDGFGNFYPPDALIFSGLMGQQRLGDALPLDYGL